MRNKVCVMAVAAIVAAVQGCASAPSSSASAALVTTDHFVPHVSTLQPIKGQRVGLFVRQKAPANLMQPGADMTGRVVLFVHGLKRGQPVQHKAVQAVFNQGPATQPAQAPSH